MDNSPNTFRNDGLDVYLHNPGAFQEEESRERLRTKFGPKAELYVAHFKTTYKLEVQYDGYQKYTCGTGDYSYDNECVYNKLDALATDGSCTTPW